jgi:hypothetical protein
MHLSVKGIIFSFVLIASVFSLMPILDLYAQENLVNAKSVGLETTTVIEFENSRQSNSDIGTIRMWLGSDNSFKSFKTEKGWTGTKTPQGVLVFTTSNPIKPGEIVKFGVKTENPKPGINWRVLTSNNVEIGTGITLVTDSSSQSSSSKISATGPGVLSESSFRLIPEKPNIGSTVRIIGENFGPNKQLDFYISNNKLETFQTDENGKFMITSKIPENLNPERVDFIIKDSENNEKKVSMRIGDANGRASPSDVPLSIVGLPSVIKRGDFIQLTGTGTPGGTITATIKDEAGKSLTSIAVPIALDGTWKYETIVAPDAPLGTQTAEISDGKETIVRSWIVKSSKVIELVPLKAMFEPGETVVINGTAIPNTELEIVVEDPQGTEFYSEVINVDASGVVNIQFKTLQSSPEGTYVIFASQNGVTDIIVLGIGELPAEPLVLRLDKINYAASDTAIVEIQGTPSGIVSLLVVDPADKAKFSDTVTLGPDGHGRYELKLAGYSSGVYTVVVKRGVVLDSEVFSVGLQTGSGPIQVRTTKESYKPGEAVLVLGSSGKSILITLTLIDPDGKTVKVKETFTNKDGIFSEDSFRIPISAQQGLWKINAKSGPNFANAEFSVIASADVGMVIQAASDNSITTGKWVKISGYGARISQNMVITITSATGEEIEKLTIISSKEGTFSSLWSIVGLDPGTYTIKAKDAVNEAVTTYVIK